MRYNLFQKAVGLILKGFTSFEKRTGYAGIGIAFGFINESFSYFNIKLSVCDYKN